MILHEQTPGAPENRRESSRARCAAEVTIGWQDDPVVICRYPADDISDGGLRIRSALPMLEGSVGRAHRLLPQGLELERPVMVIWCQRVDGSDRYEIGLRFF